MSGKLKGILIAIILLLVILVIVPDFLPDIQTAADAVSDCTTYPTVVRTIFGLWWVPIVLIMIGVILSVTGGGKRGFRRRRR